MAASTDLRTLSRTAKWSSPVTIVSIPGLIWSGKAESATTIQLRWPRAGR